MALIFAVTWEMVTQIYLNKAELRLIDKIFLKILLHINTPSWFTRYDFFYLYFCSSFYLESRTNRTNPILIVKYDHAATIRIGSLVAKLSSTNSPCWLTQP